MKRAIVMSTSMLGGALSAEEVESDIFGGGEINRWLNHLAPEAIAQSLINHVDHLKSNDTNSLDRHMQWRDLHYRVILLFIYAEQYKCPIITQTLIDIERELDEIALPIDFYKRLVRLSREVARTGNRRTRNQFRDSLIKSTFTNLREGFVVIKPSDEVLFHQYSYEDALSHTAETFNLSTKSIEKIIKKDVESVALSSVDILESEDFARFIAECKVRETKFESDLDEDEIP